MLNVTAAAVFARQQLNIPADERNASLPNDLILRAISHAIPTLGTLHCTLVADVYLYNRNIPFFRPMWDGIFGTKRTLPDNPRPHRIHHLLVAIHCAYLPLRDQFLRVLGSSTDVQAQYVLYMLEFQIPLALCM